jgi:hypothetical protein
MSRPCRPGDVGPTSLRSSCCRSPSSAGSSAPCCCGCQTSGTRATRSSARSRGPASSSWAGLGTVASSSSRTVSDPNAGGPEIADGAGGLGPYELLLLTLVFVVPVAAAIYLARKLRMPRESDGRSSGPGGPRISDASAIALLLLPLGSRPSRPASRDATACAGTTPTPRRGRTATGRSARETRHAFAEALAEGPHTDSPAERRALLREANAAIASQVRGYYARPWAEGDADSVLRTFVCECGDVGCEASVELALGDLSSEAVLAPGHS